MQGVCIDTACAEIRSQELSQDRIVVDGGKWYVVVNDNRLEAAIQDHGEDGVFETSDEHRLIGELVLRPAEFTKLVPQIRPHRLTSGTDKQHFKIRPICCSLLAAQRQTIGQITHAVFFPFPLVKTSAIRMGHDCSTDCPRQPGSSNGIA